MKFGIRKPNIRKSIKARTTGKLKRKIKKATNPFYGKKGIDYIKNFKGAIYNKIYNKATFGKNDILKNTDNKKSKKIKNKKEAIFMAEQWLKVAQESANLINSTKNPDIFFGRYNLLIEKMKLLSNAENIVKFESKKPSEDLKDILDKKQLSIKEFIDRYYNETEKKVKGLTTQKAKENSINKFCEQLEFYNEEMLEENINYYQQLYNDLKNKYLS